MQAFQRYKQQAAAAVTEPDAVATNSHTALNEQLEDLPLQPEQPSVATVMVEVQEEIVLQQKPLIVRPARLSSQKMTQPCCKWTVCTPVAG